MAVFIVWNAVTDGERSQVERFPNVEEAEKRLSELHGEYPNEDNLSIELVVKGTELKAEPVETVIRVKLKGLNVDSL